MRKIVLIKQHHIVSNPFSRGNTLQTKKSPQVSFTATFYNEPNSVSNCAKSANDGPAYDLSNNKNRLCIIDSVL